MAIPKIDLRGVEPGVPGWEEARAAVTASMVAHGCVVVAYDDALGPDLRHALFGRALPELFAHPLETKQRNVGSRGQFRGYLARPKLNYESVCVEEPTDDDGNINHFTSLFWPQGNPEFSDIMLRFAKNSLKLEQTLQKMTLEGLDVPEESIRSHLRSLSHTLRPSHYCPQQETGSSPLSMEAHRDFNMTTLVFQHEVEGLEVQATKGGSWLPVRPEPNTFTFQAGDLFTLVTNGRVPASVHRVRTCNRERFSMVFGSWSRDDDVVSTIEELVDGDHPLVYNPCRPDKYVEFLVHKEGNKLDDPLKAFCGVHKGISVE